MRFDQYEDIQWSRLRPMDEWLFWTPCGLIRCDDCKRQLAVALLGWLEEDKGDDDGSR